MLKRTCAVLAVTFAGACGASTPSPSAPSTLIAVPPPRPAPPPPSAFHLTGIVTEDDGNPLAGVTITVHPTVWVTTNPFATVSGVTDGRGFYSIDFDANRDLFDLIGWVNAESAGHDRSYYYLRASSQDASQNIHLYRIRRMTAGESTVLTVLPSDTACGDNDQFLCRTIHIVAPSDGLMTIEAVPTPSVAIAGLEILGRSPAYHCCSLTSSLPVTAGTEVIANVGAWWTSTASQSFVLNTSLVRP